MAVDGLELWRPIFSWVSFGNTLFFQRAALQMNANTHGMHGIAFNATHVKVILRHEQSRFPILLWLTDEDRSTSCPFDSTARLRNS